MTPSATSGWIDAKTSGASGSEFEVIGKIKEGSDKIEVDNIGDFEIGQWVTVSKCYLHHHGMIYNTEAPYFAKNQSPLKDEIEIRGLDLPKEWQVFVLHFENTNPVTFKWLAVDPKYQTKTTTKPIIRREWCWQGENIPITGEWINLADGVQIRFNKLDWLPGQSASFHARNRLTAQITDISENTLTLSKTANCSATDAVVRHNDQIALQSAIDKAIVEKKGVFIPAGRYRLSTGLWIRNTSLRIEGAHREHTILDASEDNTPAFWISGGKDVQVRNLAMTGHTGFMELPSNMPFKTETGFPFWPTANEEMQVKGCAAANVVSTEHLLFEDVNVARMASEAFYLHGSDRYGEPPYIQEPHEGMDELQKQYTKSCIFNRCRVVDCGFNAFNNNDHGENTSILHCHVERVLNFCEGAGRFTRIIGNYVLDGCASGIHGGTKNKNMELGPCQAIISDNIFEAGNISGGISIGDSATQVIVSNNMFIGYGKESAITAISSARHVPCRSIIITGNSIDLTAMEGQSNNERVGISIECSNVTVANNQIFVRGENNPKTTGIQIADHVTNINAHDNIIENCDHGLRSGCRVYIKDKNHFEFHHTESEVSEVIDSKSFIDQHIPGTWDRQPACENWNILWKSGANTGKVTKVVHLETEKRTVTLQDNISINTGDKFFIYPDYSNWQIHHNTMYKCANPLLIDLLNTGGIFVKENIGDGKLLDGI